MEHPQFKAPLVVVGMQPAPDGQPTDLIRTSFSTRTIGIRDKESKLVQGASLASFASILKMFDKIPQLTSSASTARMQKDDHPFPGFFFTLVPSSNHAALSVCVSLAAAGHETRRKRCSLTMGPLRAGPFLISLSTIMFLLLSRNGELSTARKLSCLLGCNN
ncbi:hypothetical protein SEVIR_9G346801v4 [Setaria viridis]